MAEQEKKKGVHWGVKAWVFFHLFMITSWSLPKPPDRLEADPKVKSVGQAVRDVPNYLLLYNWRFKRTEARRYLEFTGFWQYWNMFSPNPANMDVWIDAEVEFADGTVMVYEYPAMQNLSVFERYFKERYRKFVENMHLDKYSYKWPAVAQAIAYRSYAGDGNLPVRVTLRRHFREITPLTGLSPPPDYTPPDYQTYAFFTYEVDTKRLATEAHK